MGLYYVICFIIYNVIHIPSHKFNIMLKYSRNIKHNYGCFLHIMFCCFPSLFEYWPKSIACLRWEFMIWHIEILDHCHDCSVNHTISSSCHIRLSLSLHVPFCFKTLAGVLLCQRGFQAPTPSPTQESQLCLVNFYSIFRSQLDHIRIILSNLTKPLNSVLS